MLKCIAKNQFEQNLFDCLTHLEKFQIEQFFISFLHKLPKQQREKMFYVIYQLNIGLKMYYNYLVFTLVLSQRRLKYAKNSIELLEVEAIMRCISKKYSVCLENISKYKNSEISEMIFEIKKFYTVPTNIKNCICKKEIPKYGYTYSGKIEFLVNKFI